MSKHTPLTGEERAGFFATQIFNYFVDGWLLMLAFGVAHAAAAGIPPFGYWQSFFFAFVIAGLAGTGVSGVDAKVKHLIGLVT